MIWVQFPVQVLVNPAFTGTVYQNVLEDFIIPSTEDRYGDADFIFQQDLAPAHTARITKTWFDAHAITVLDWPAPRRT